MKKIVITGASKGIGLELVKLGLDHGHHVVALARQIEDLEQLKTIFPNLKTFSCDLAEIVQIKSASYLISEVFDQVDVLINNAGLLVNKPFKEILPEDIDASYAVNFKAPYLLTQYLYPLLNISAMAHVVNISSMGGYQGSQKFPGLSAYSAIKGALACLSECLAVEFADTSVKVNALCLGSADTEMLRHAFPGYKAQVSAKEMAAYIFDFALSAHKVINGKVIPVASSNP